MCGYDYWASDEGSETEVWDSDEEHQRKRRRKEGTQPMELSEDEWPENDAPETRPIYVEGVGIHPAEDEEWEWEDKLAMAQLE